MQTLYSIIKELCKKHNVSVSELESELDFSRGSLCKWDVNVPSVVKVKAVADYFGISVDQLLGGDEKIENNN